MWAGEICCIGEQIVLLGADSADALHYTVYTFPLHTTQLSSLGSFIARQGPVSLYIKSKVNIVAFWMSLHIGKFVVFEIGPFIAEKRQK